MPRDICDITKMSLLPLLSIPKHRNFRDRRLFIKTISEGDTIFVLPGSPVPTIMRGQEDQKGVSTVASDAYVHGIMDGETTPRGGEGMETDKVHFNVKSPKHSSS
ncbi:hypothetical protein F4775DRAFT_591680 [Biscogniauxia sp. FL1348]|nr:hypothetical protein F4775DRAFT_591680 [Biscogniauxia sp. FL1348]